MKLEPEMKGKLQTIKEKQRTFLEFYHDHHSLPYPPRNQHNKPHPYVLVNQP